jgi:hypothetical protein
LTLGFSSDLISAMKIPAALFAAACILFACNLQGQATSTGGKPLSGDIPVKLPPNTLKTRPLILGTVTAGQKVTLTAVKVQWSGGGSKAGVFCDWRGHNPDKPLANGIPWMALVASVGKKEYWPKTKSAFSFTVKEDGELVLYANDEQGGNLGEAEILVKVSPK